MDERDADRALKEVTAHLGLKANVRVEYEEKARTIRESFDGRVFDYCMDRFLAAEMDTASPGIRGLGRLSTQLPRLGAYMRSKLARLDREAQLEISEALRNLALTGYCLSALGSNPFSSVTGKADPEAVYQTWVPGMYAGPVPPELWAMIDAASRPALVRVVEIMRTKGVKGGGFLSKDRTPELLAYYPLIAFAIHVIERNSLRLAEDLWILGTSKPRADSGTKT